MASEKRRPPLRKAAGAQIAQRGCDKKLQYTTAMCHLIRACLSRCGWVVGGGLLGWWAVGAWVWVGGCFVCVVCVCGLRFVVCGLWCGGGWWVVVVLVVGVCVVCVSILNCTRA